MGSLDRLGWAGSAVFDSYGVRIGIRVADEALLPRVCSAVPPGSRVARGARVDRLYSFVPGGPLGDTGIRRFYMAYDGHTVVARSLDLDAAIERLESSIRMAVASATTRRVFVHAGVVAWRGRAILIPAPSRSGKTSLVDALVRAGATYYSDEYAVLDRTGRVHPFPKPMTIRAAGMRPRVRRLPDAIGACPLSAAVVVVTSYREAAEWRPARMSAAAAVFALLANTVQARIRPEVALAVLGKVASRATAVEGPRGDAGRVAEQILSLVESSEVHQGEP